jgi:hypothetical protein
MTEMEGMASEAFALALEQSLGLQGLAASAGYDVTRQIWMMGWAQGRLSAFQQQLAMREAASALRQ